MTMTEYRSRWPLVLFMVMALSTAACSSAAHGSPTVAAASSLTTSASSTATIAPGTTAGTATATRASTSEEVSHSPICRTSQLRITVPWTGAAAGTVGGRIGFTNVAASPCHLRGWPALTAITAQGKTSTAIDRITTMFGPDLRTAPLVTLRHGATAEAVFTGGDNPGPGQTTCPPSYRLLRVIPPGSSQPVTLPAWIGYYNHDLPACTPIWVSEVVPYADLYQGRQGK
jgi:Protein of unknown function (DUF4232)